MKMKVERSTISVDPINGEYLYGIFVYKPIWFCPYWQWQRSVWAKNLEEAKILAEKGLESLEWEVKDGR